MSTEVIPEDGFLVIDCYDNSLSGRAEFFTTIEAAESEAKRVVAHNPERSFPSLVLSVTRFTTDQIRRLRGESSS